MDTTSNGELFPVDVLRRPNQTFAMLPKTGKITAVMQRLFATMLYFSQRDGKEEVYRRTLGELMTKANYTSRNTIDVKNQLRAMQGNQVEWYTQNGDESRWGVSGMIAQVEIVEQKGVPTIVEWALPPKIQAQLLDPTSYTSLVLHLYTTLRSNAAIALYGICARYSTNPSGVTMRERWEWWLPRLTGNPDSEPTDEYKYFKRDVLKRAIAEVNTLTDVVVELVEHKIGLRVLDIQFRVERKPEFLLGVPEVAHDFSDDVDADLLEQILRIGMKEKPARELCAKHEAEFLLRTLALTEQRASDPKLPQLGSKAAFFRTALRDRYADTMPKKDKASAAVSKPDSPEQKKARVRSGLLAKRTKDAYDAYRELNIDEQEAVRDEFAQATKVTAFRTEMRRHGLAKSAALRSAFSEWYAQKLWGEPSEQELMDYMLEQV